MLLGKYKGGIDWAGQDQGGREGGRDPVSFTNNPSEHCAPEGMRWRCTSCSAAAAAAVLKKR